MDDYRDFEILSSTSRPSARKARSATTALHVATTRKRAVGEAPGSLGPLKQKVNLAEAEAEIEQA
jgi:hypothetical protein